MINKIKKNLKNHRKKGHRIRTIFLHYKKLKKFEDLSDITLFNCIIHGLIELREKYSRDEVYVAFREVDKNDYDKKDKIPALKEFLEIAEVKSVF